LLILVFTVSEHCLDLDIYLCILFIKIQVYFYMDSIPKGAEVRTLLASTNARGEGDTCPQGYEGREDSYEGKNYLLPCKCVTLGICSYWVCLHGQEKAPEAEKTLKTRKVDLPRGREGMRMMGEENIPHEQGDQVDRVGVGTLRRGLFGVRSWAVPWQATGTPGLSGKPSISARSGSDDSVTFHLLLNLSGPWFPHL
jgi:hypothetical protein